MCNNIVIVTPNLQKTALPIFHTHYIMKSRSFYSFLLPFYNRITDIRMIFILIRGCVSPPFPKQLTQSPNKTSLKGSVFRYTGVINLPKCFVK